VHFLASLIVHIDMVAKIDPPALDVPCNSVPCLPERITGHGVSRHHGPFRIHNCVGAIAQMEVIQRHAKKLLRLAGARRISRSPRGQREARRWQHSERSWIRLQQLWPHLSTMVDNGHEQMACTARFAPRCRVYFLICVIFDPSSPSPPIKPFWPKGKA
jgi:hypothetical protein